MVKSAAPERRAAVGRSWAGGDGAPL